MQKWRERALSQIPDTESRRSASTVTDLRHLSHLRPDLRPDLRPGLRPGLRDSSSFHNKPSLFYTLDFD